MIVTGGDGHRRGLLRALAKAGGVVYNIDFKRPRVCRASRTCNATSVMWRANELLSCRRAHC